MAIVLTKGGNINISKEAPGLKKIIVGLGWNARATEGVPFDLDANAFMLPESGKIRDDKDFIYYRNPVSACGSVEHKGDNRTGDGDGDDETIIINLDLIPADIQKIACSVTIHEAPGNGQNFGQVSNAYIRIVNEETGAEVARYDLSEDASVETAMIFGELYRNNGEWKFKAVGQGFTGGIKTLIANFGGEAA